MTMSERYPRPSACWKEQSDPLFRFWIDNKSRAYSFFSVLETLYDKEAEALIVQFPLGTLIVTGPKTGQFYVAFCGNKVTDLKADGQDILTVDWAERGTAAAEQAAE